MRGEGNSHEALAFQGPGRSAWQDVGVDVVIEAVGEPEGFEMCAHGAARPYEVFARSADTGALKVAFGGGHHDAVALRTDEGK